jgi:hypothetical protein
MGLQNKAQQQQMTQQVQTTAEPPEADLDESTGQLLHTPSIILARNFSL